MSGKSTFRICGRKLTIPATPILPDMKWEDLVQPSPIENDFGFSREFFNPEKKRPSMRKKKVIRRKRTKAAN